MGFHPDITLFELELFSEVARHSSLRGVARQKGLTPGHVSKSLKRLERKLGVSLFRRSSTGVVLSPEGQRLDSCTIITTAANSLMQQVHTRMPVILDPADYTRWLDRDRQNAQEVLDMLKPFPADRMQLTPVSTLVNSPRNDRPECALPQLPPGKQRELALE